MRVVVLFVHNQREEGTETFCNTSVFWTSVHAIWNLSNMAGYFATVL